MGCLAFVKFALIRLDALAWPLFALGYPLRASIQAIEADSSSDSKKLVTYWVIFSLISLFEHAFMGLLQWLPFWPYMKLTLVGWLMIPRFDGALYVYDNFVHPCLYVDMQTVINWFRKQQEFFLNDNFLAEADKYVKANGPEALEKLIPTESKDREPSMLQKEIKPVRVTQEKETAAVNLSKDREPSTLQKEIKPVRVAEVKETAAVNLIPETEPSAAQTQVKMLAVARPEIKEATGWDLPELPSDKQVQKEWTCAMCQVTTSCEKNLNMHLQGRRHRAACEGLMKAKNQPSKGKVAPASAVKDSKKEPEKRASSSSTQASQKMQQPSNGQVSAASVAKNSDLLKNEPEKCATSNGTPTSSKAVNPKTGISNGSKPDLPKEEPKNSLPKNKAGNQQKSREKVQGQQQSGKKHAKINNPQFRCTICNISCGRSEDLNCHLWGRKHLARIQELNRLGQSELA
ncbi:PREDICTED: uncharacterized protein LOC18608185 isoform X1 [Theobroma cacao]|uniref:Uncharacterized protein LOC18608185 isoform X1 n=1 Tax=Theobroma cacao TaxID=3641 RepID=A0AB32VWC1_THECC|nr:PREDICTED: uncharacterized protein LOC18608185 isoform X1 [Theobroma cacao]